MTIKDYARKHARAAQNKGLATAASQATSEAVLKGLSPVADSISRPIWADEWDICLVLDACRYDLWRDVTVGMELFDGQHRSEWSVGSASPEWMTDTFGQEYDQQVRRAGYVTANPFSGKQGDETAALDESLFPLEGRGFAYLDEAWRDAWHSDGLPTVRPETLTDRAMWAYDNREMDRLIVHYMQPHIPFRDRPEWCSGWNVESFGTGGGHADKDDWHRVRDGEIPAGEFWDAYADNLAWVLGEVRRWASCYDARILVTSDHGNAMGEWGQWSHPPGSANPVLRRVPWVLIDGSGDETPAYDVETAPSQAGGDALDEQLSALGYK